MHFRYNFLQFKLNYKFNLNFQNDVKIIKFESFLSY